MTRAWSDVGTKVYTKLPTEAAFKQIMCPTSIPDLGGASESIDTTTMCDPVSTSIPGRQTLPEMPFAAFYDGEAMIALQPYLKVQDTQTVVVLPDGYGYFFTGQWDSWVAGYGINEAVPSTIQWYPAYRSDLLTPAEINALVPLAVTITPISNKTVSTGGSVYVPVTTVPTDAVITATATGMAADVTVSGSTLTVTGDSTGSATITVRAQKAGYVEGMTTFLVTVTS